MKSRTGHSNKKRTITFVGLVLVGLSSCLGAFNLQTRSAGASSGFTWSSPVVLDAKAAGTSPYFSAAYTINSIACPGPNLCVAVNTDGEIDLSTNPSSGTPTWSLMRVDSDLLIKSISCPSLSFCVAVDTAGNAIVSTNPTGGSSAWVRSDIDGAIGMFSVSCASTLSCVAVDSLGNYLFYNGSSWTAPVTTGATFGLNSVSCVISTTFCVAVGSTAAYVDNGGTWSATAATGESNTLTSVSCISTTFCAAGDSGGGIAIYNGSTWTVLAGLDSTNTVEAIYCGIGCVAVDSLGKSFGSRHPTTSPASWMAPATIDPGHGIFAVACVPGSFGGCIAGDNAGQILTNPGPLPPTYSPPVPQVPPVTINSISCVSTSFCAAVTSAGQGITYNGSSWSTPSPFAQVSLNAVSCVSSSFCIAVGSQGNAFEFNGTIWETSGTVPALAWSNPVDSTQPILSVSCVSTSFCMAGDAGGNSVFYNGSTWTVTALSSSLTVTSISCPSAIFCMAVSSSGYAYAYTGTWSAQVNVDATGPIALSGVSCPTSTYCVAVDRSGNYFQYSGGSWSSSASLPGVTSSSAVSCVSPTFCVAVNDSAGTYNSFNGSTWTSAAPSGSPSASLGSVSCISSVFCVGGADAAVPGGGAGGIYLFSSGWSLKDFVDNPITSTYCQSTSLCVVGDSIGDIVSYNSTTTTWTNTAPFGDVDGKYPIEALSCVSTSFCMAVDVRGFYTVYNGSTWGGATTIGGSGPFTSLSCVSTSFCVAAGGGPGAVAVFTGTWTVNVPDSTNMVGQVSCGSVSFCVAVDNAGNYLVYNGSTWTVAVNFDGTNSLTGISCTSATFCVAVDNAGNAFTYNGSTWAGAIGNPISPGPFSSVSCTGTPFCVASSNNAIFNWDGGGWDLPVPVPGGFPIFSISCTGMPPSLCIAGGSRGFVTTSTTPAGSPIPWSAFQVDGANGETAITCPTAGVCEIGDNHGNILYSSSPTVIVPSNTTAANVDGVTAITAIGCTATISFCVAGDGVGDMLYSSNPTAAIPTWSLGNVDGTFAITSVACPSVMLCVAVDNYGDVLTSSTPSVLTTASWVSGSVTPAMSITGISCPSTSLCVAVNSSGSVLDSTNPAGGPSSWVSYSASAIVLNSVSCPSTTMCVTTDNAGDVLSSQTPTTSGSWTTAHVDGTNYIISVSCPSTNYCAAVDNAGNVIDSTSPTGGAAKWSVTNINGALVFTAISCANSYNCDAVDSSGDVISGNQIMPPPPPPSVVTTVTLSPNGANFAPGSSGTITATVSTATTISGATITTPDAGVLVSFDVSTGPDAGQSATVTTDANGLATFTVVNSGVPGQDTITANTSGTIALASATMNFAGVYTLSVSPTSQGGIATVDTLSITANLIDPSGNPSSNQTIAFAVMSGPDAGQSTTATTDSKGDATFSVSAAKAGTDSIAITFSPPGITGPVATAPVSSLATLKWAAPVNISTSSSVPNGSTGTPSNPAPPGGSVNLSLMLTSPAAAQIRPNEVDSFAPLSGLVKIRGGQYLSRWMEVVPPISSSRTSSLSGKLLVDPGRDLVSNITSGTVTLVGVPVNFNDTSGPDSGKSGTVNTDATGTASWTLVNSGNPGTDSVSASFADSAGLVHSATFTVTFASLPPTTVSSSSTLASSTTQATVASTTMATSPSTPSQVAPTFQIAPPSSPTSGGATNGTTSTSQLASSTTVGSTSTTEHTTSHLEHKTTSTSLGSKSSIRALGPTITNQAGQVAVDGFTNNSNGNLVSPKVVRALVASGQPGPAMSYSSGYGLGAGGGPPGPAGLSRSVPSMSVAFHNIKKTIKGNAGLAVLLLFLVGLPAMVFNSALKEHEGKIVANVGPIRRGFAKVQVKLESVHPLNLLLGFSVVGALLYALDDPAFGLNFGTLAEIIGFALAIIVSTAVTEILRGVYVHRRFNKVGDLRAFPLGIGVALIFDVFSRISHFEPGYVFGIMAAMMFRTKPTGEEDGRSTSLAYVWLFLVGVVAWIAYGSVNSRVIAGNHGFWLLVAESLLSYLWICGLQALFFSLIPARYMDGEIIFRWSKTVWAIMYVVVTFIFVQFILHPTAAGYGGNSNTSIIPMLAIFIASSIAAAVFWLYAHMKYGRMASIGEVLIEESAN